MYGKEKNYVMISVCMATYNGERYLKEQIDSILLQLDEYDELVISDDGSVDATVDIIESYNDKRIKLLKYNSYNYTQNFENALCNCSGEYIFLSDQDDVWKDNKVKVCLQYLKSGYDMVMHNAIVADEDLHVILNSRNNFYNVKNGFVKNFIKTRYLGCCLAFNNQILKYSLPFPGNHELCLHDAWISLNAEFKFKTIVISEPLIIYRRHNKNVSSGGNSTSNLFKVVKIRIYLLINILHRFFMRKEK